MVTSQHLKSVSEDCGDLSELRHDSAAQFMERIAGAIERLADGENKDAQLKQHAEITHNLIEAATKVAQKIIEIEPALKTIDEELSKVASHVTISALHDRFSGGFSHFGGILWPVTHKIDALRALAESCRNFMEQMTMLGTELDSKPSQQTSDLGRSAVAAFVKALARSREVLDLSPSDAKGITNAAGHIKHLQADYFSAAAVHNNPLFDLFGIEPEDNDVEEKLPVFGGKTLLSLALVETVRTLPTLKRLDQCEGNPHTLSRSLENFVSAMSVMCDTRFLAAVTDDTILEHTIKALEALQNLGKELRAFVKESRIEHAVAEANTDGSRTFREFFESADLMDRHSGLLGERDSSSGMMQVLRQLGDRKLTLADFEPATATPSQGSMNELYGEIMRLLIPTAKGELKIDVELVHELVVLRDAALRGASSTVRVRRLIRDNDKGNYCFNIVAGGRGGLTLEQVPTAGVSLDQLVGAKWQVVIEKVRTLAAFEQRRWIYSDLSARGKCNSNLLIVSPVGMGKNHFGRAIGSMREIVVIQASTDRLVSKWLGEAEQNVRKIFEMAAEAHEKFNRPVALTFDEIDSFFPHRTSRSDDGAHHAIVGMQKTLQSVLDGDTVYEGVALIGFTNEAKGIPVPMYRRFGSVHIIQPFTAQERRKLLTMLIEQLPLDSAWSKNFPWERYEKESQFASGDMIGKIYDALLEEVLRKGGNRGEAILNLNDQVRVAVEEHSRLNKKQRLELWQEHLPGATLTAKTVSRITFDVLDLPENRLSREQQKKFYDNVEDHLRDAFSDSI